MWMLISIFGSNQKRLSMDNKKHRSKRFTGNNESVQKLIEEDIDVSVAGDELVENRAFKDESEEKFSEIIKRLIARKQGEIQTCKDLLEAFHVLDSEEEESLLKKKSSHDEDDQSLGDSKRVEEEEEQDAVVLLPKRKCNFFSKKWRSEERKRNRTCQVSKTIVVLKPAAPNSLDVVDSSSSSNKSKTGRTFSRFIIGLIKRRLLQSAVGKKSCDVHVDKSRDLCVEEKIQSKYGKHVSDEEEPLCRETDKEETVHTSEEDSKKIMSGLYIAARKHLSEMLANGDIDVNLPDKEVPRILGKILSLPEFSSPGDTPILIPFSQTTEEPEILQCSEDSDKDDDETLFTIDVSVPIDNSMLSDHAKETGKAEIEPLSETSSSSISRQDDGDKQSSNKEMMFSQVHSVSSSPESPVKMSECKETASDVQGELSPVSVLEPLFTDDESSPTTSTRFSSAEMRIQPLCIRFDEADSPKPDKPNYLKTSMDDDDDKELTLAYIEDVVKSSGLSWEELLTRPFYSERLLELEESTDDIAFCSTQLCDDKNLLNDCINEVLMDFCENELNPGPWISFVKPEVQLISDMEVAAKVAQEGVYWHLLPLPSPHTLDQIVKKDMAKAGSWMDLRFDIGWIGSCTSELILDDLVEEIIRSCTDMVQVEPMQEQNSNSL
ncbi:Phosphatidylinositol N-acetyglucosaminlytransferase subunit P-related [Raphanus sativus]|nr:Phosphatidylinositol N-acetyglucosaminlytransferase subunit P-related [Raphanus sativus]